MNSSWTITASPASKRCVRGPSDRTHARRTLATERMSTALPCVEQAFLDSSSNILRLGGGRCIQGPLGQETYESLKDVTDLFTSWKDHSNAEIENKCIFECFNEKKEEKGYAFLAALYTPANPSLNGSVPRECFSSHPHLSDPSPAFPSDRLRAHTGCSCYERCPAVAYDTLSMEPTSEALGTQLVIKCTSSTADVCSPQGHLPWPKPSLPHCECAREWKWTNPDDATSSPKDGCPSTEPRSIFPSYPRQEFNLYPQSAYHQGGTDNETEVLQKYIVRQPSVLDNEHKRFGPYSPIFTLSYCKAKATPCIPPPMTFTMSPENVEYHHQHQLFNPDAYRRLRELIRGNETVDGNKYTFNIKGSNYTLYNWTYGQEGYNELIPAKELPDQDDLMICDQLFTNSFSNPDPKLQP